MKKILYIIIANIITISTIAQNVEFTQANFPTDKNGLKTALSNIKSGNKIFNDALSGIEYTYALNYYLQAQQFNPNNAELNYKIAKCYYESGNTQKAYRYGETAYKLNPQINYEVLLYTAGAYQSRMEFDSAIALYRAYAANSATSAKEKDMATKRIAECERGKNMIRYEYNCFIDNLGNVVNGDFDEYGPVITMDNSSIYFTSRREGKKIKMADDGKYYENVYKSQINDKGDFEAPVRVLALCNKKHVAVQAISKDGNNVIVYQPTNGGDLYESAWKNGKFQKPKKMSNKINTRYHETSASYSITGDTLYFCSEKEGGYGNHDIYMSVRDAKGKWGTAQNLGIVINTADDEISVYAHPDGTLYFCSNGHETMGGIDIFFSKMENGQWTAPQNIGYPINTPDDDVYFVVTQDGKFAYYASDKAEGYGGQDLYKITLLGPQKLFALYMDNDWLVPSDLLEEESAQAMAIEKEKITIVKGVILDADTKLPVYANIELSDVEENELLATFTSDSISGEYLLSLPSGKNYAVAVKATGYLFHSENFNIPDTADDQEIVQVIYMERIAVNKAIVLKNIFFDHNKTTLRAASLIEIENIYKLLTENPNLCIEISGHTDNVGSAAYNKKLSLGRAKAVVDALVKKGIDPSRLTSAGYGFDKPIASNKTPEGRQLNRRTEFKVTKM
ncbi:MAG: OmpA family protein [Bacteroidales bacterium]|nr:OmpA family protein [Bacteroidales bacterium]